MTPLTAANRSGRLRPNTIGPWGLAALAIGITSPAMGLYGLWGPMQTAAGPIAPLIFLAAMLLVLPTAISYALLNREAPSSAAAAAWLWISVSPIAGVVAGLLMSTYFVMAAVAQPLMFALFFRDLLDQLAIGLPSWVALPLGILLASVPVAWACLRGAEASVKSTVRLMLIETFVVLALSATILAVKWREGGVSYLAPFDPRNAHGFTGFWVAMILGVLAFCGFDVVSTAAEEAHAPREYLPKAILLTVIGIALFWAVNAWAFTLSAPNSQVEQYTREGLTAVTPVARAYWGWGALAVILTAFTGLTAVYLSSMQGASRILFALSRHGVLPSALAHLAGEKRVPKNAVLSVLFAVILLDLMSLWLLHNGLDAFTWWANALVFFAALTFLGVNVANICYFWRRMRHKFSAVGNLLIPAIGVTANAYLLYEAFFSSLWSGDWRTGKSVVVACTAILAAELVFAGCIRSFRRDLLHQSAPLVAESSREPLENEIPGQDAPMKG